MPKNPHADFSPVLDGYSGIGAFRFWCQTALPLTYDDSLSYYELLNKVVNYLNHTIEDLTTVESNTSALAEAYNKLQKYVNDYFDDIDIEAELRNVLDAMTEDGTLDALLNPIVENQLPGVVEEQIDNVVAEQIDGAVAGQIDESVADQLPALVSEGIPNEVTGWLEENVDPVGSAVVVDSSLTIGDAAADAKVTGDKIGELKTQIGYEKTTLYSFSSSKSQSDVAVNYKWIINHIYTAGTTISNIIFNTNLTDGAEVIVTLYYFDTTVPGYITQYNYTSYTCTAESSFISIPLNKTFEKDTLIGISSADTFAITASPDDGESDRIKRLNMDTTQTAASTGWLSYGIFCKAEFNNSQIDKNKENIEILDNRINDIENILYNEIHVGPGFEYEEIQEAIDSLTGNYAVIIVHPKSGTYSRFSLMRKLNEEYPWSGLTTVKNISIIGIDKSKCIIQDNSGNYETPPAEIATNGIIKNLTFIATHTDSDGTETTGSYAVHVDNRPADANGMKLTFENCDFISYQTAAVGLGLYRNQDIKFIGCNFLSYTDTTWQPNGDYNSTYMCTLGAYFMHTAGNLAGGNMFVRFRNNIFYHEGGQYSFRAVDNDDPKTAILEAIGNTLWDATSANIGYYPTSNPLTMAAYNHGNNATQLNG